MTLQVDAINEFSSRQGALSIIWNGNNYNPISFLANPLFISQYLSAFSEEMANERAVIILSNTPLNVTNEDIIDIGKTAITSYQQLLDGYEYIISQINNGSITTTGQIAPAWNSFNASYVNQRVEMPSIESIYDNIQTLQAEVALLQTARSYTYPARALNTAYQPSTTRDTQVSAGVTVTCTLTLSGGQVGTVVLEYADDSGITTNIKTVCTLQNGNSGSVVIGVSLGQPVTLALVGIVPAAKYYRLRTVNTTGSPSFSLTGVQEVLL